MKPKISVVILNDAIRSLIVDNKPAMEIRNTALQNGYVPLIVDGINKTLAGITNLNELNNKLALY